MAEATEARIQSHYVFYPRPSPASEVCEFGEGVRVREQASQPELPAEYREGLALAEGCEGHECRAKSPESRAAATRSGPTAR